MNTNLVHADIFFYISSIGFFVLAVLAVIVLVYLISLLNDLKQIFQIIKKQSTMIAEDIENLRGQVANGGMKLRYLYGFISSLFFNKKKGKNNAKKQ